jgi:hypothetical protein
VVSIGAPYVKEQGGSITLVSGTPARRPKPGQVALSCVGASVEQLTRTVRGRAKEEDNKGNGGEPRRERAMQ